MKGAAGREEVPGGGVMSVVADAETVAALVIRREVGGRLKANGRQAPLST